MLSAAVAGGAAAERARSMSTPPPPLAPGFVPPPTRKSGFPWMACGIGCLVVLVLAGAVTAFVAFKAKQAFDQIEAQAERMAETANRQRAAREQIEDLDRTFPSSLGEDPGSAELADADIAQYLNLHAGLAASVAVHQELEARVSRFEQDLDKWADPDSNEEPSFREVWGTFSEIKDAITNEFAKTEALTAVLEQAQVVMEAEGLGRTKLRRLCAIIDLKFLEREGFDELALPPEDASALRTARAQVELGDNSEFDPVSWDRDEWDNFQAQLVEHRATIERLEAEIAAARGTLTEGTRVKLESRRSELEAISTEAAFAVYDLTREGWYYEWVDEWDAEAASDAEGGSAD